MIYGNKFLPKKEESISMIEFGIESIAYNEYRNYKSLLESCTDDSSRPILEAQVTILREVSFKDIIERIKKAWKDFKEWIMGIFEKIFGKKEHLNKIAKESEAMAKEIQNKTNELKANKTINEDELYKVKYINKINILSSTKNKEKNTMETTNFDYQNIDEVVKYIKELVINEQLELINNNQIRDIDAILSNNSGFSIDDYKKWSEEYEESAKLLEIAKVSYNIEYDEKEVDLYHMSSYAADLTFDISKLNACMISVDIALGKIKNIYKETDKKLDTFFNQNKVEMVNPISDEKSDAREFQLDEVARIKFKAIKEIMNYLQSISKAFSLVSTNILVPMADELHNQVTHLDSMFIKTTKLVLK